MQLGCLSMAYKMASRTIRKLMEKAIVALPMIIQMIAYHMYSNIMHNRPICVEVHKNQINDFPVNRKAYSFVW